MIEITNNKNKLIYNTKAYLNMNLNDQLKYYLVDKTKYELHSSKQVILFVSNDDYLVLRFSYFDNKFYIFTHPKYEYYVNNNIVKGNDSELDNITYKLKCTKNHNPIDILRQIRQLTKEHYVSSEFVIELEELISSIINLDAP